MFKQRCDTIRLGLQRVTLAALLCTYRNRHSEEFSEEGVTVTCGAQYWFLPPPNVDISVKDIRLHDACSNNLPQALGALGLWWGFEGLPRVQKHPRSAKYCYY